MIELTLEFIFYAIEKTWEKAPWVMVLVVFGLYLLAVNV